MKPNNITRAIVDATVDRSLREIEEDPRRSIRKLTDLGRQFSKGRFLQEVVCHFSGAAAERRQPLLYRH